jgi:hypothetical protein
MRCGRSSGCDGTTRRRVVRRHCGRPPRGTPKVKSDHRVAADERVLLGWHQLAVRRGGRCFGRRSRRAATAGARFPGSSIPQARLAAARVYETHMPGRRSRGRATRPGSLLRRRRGEAQSAPPLSCGARPYRHRRHLIFDGFASLDGRGRFPTAVPSASSSGPRAIARPRKRAPGRRQALGPGREVVAVVVDVTTVRV